MMAVNCISTYRHTCTPMILFTALQTCVFIPYTCILCIIMLSEVMLSFLLTVMDYVRLLTKMLTFNTPYNLILEDDVKPAKYALHKVHEFAAMLEYQTDWGVLTFYSGIRRKSFVFDTRRTGLAAACAWLYRKDVAESCLQMLQADPQRWPVDLLVPAYVFDKLDLKAYERTPNLFQHISAVSTYTGQVS